MNNLRIRFVRGEEVKYISHLDLMKVFERAARRSNIPVAYSQGFNPHPNIVFGLPLSVGVTSEAEYADIELSERMEAEDFILKLNMSLPRGLYITEVAYRTTKSNIMAIISRADYSLVVAGTSKEGINSISLKINELMEKPEIIIKKESKSGARHVDIRPMIHRLEISTECKNVFLLDYIDSLLEGFTGGTKYTRQEINCLNTRLSAGSAANLKPELVVLALNQLSDVEIRLLKIHRTGLYVERDGRIYAPLEHNVL
ncbi:MAG: TIGR03936 family radical SAM-associated protein [Clostridia bacterium]|nr:TIGR03936 family radical SAM-associated protein [Clostridia bacterium]